MKNTEILSDQGRKFFFNQATQLKAAAQPVLLETSTEHSTYSGRVLQVEDGGLIFQISDTLTEICIPWEKVNYLGRITTPADAAERVGARGIGA
jgi:hypothetical protein